MCPLLARSWPPTRSMKRGVAAARRRTHLYRSASSVRTAEATAVAPSATASAPGWALSSASGSFIRIGSFVKISSGVLGGGEL